jgi:hypothetical protein
MPAFVQLPVLHKRLGSVLDSACNGNELAYHFIRGGADSTHVRLEMIVDGDDGGVSILLNPDGTWEATISAYPLGARRHFNG